MPVEYKGDTKAFNNVVFNLYVAPGCCDGCSGCCTNSLAIMLTGGSHLCGVAPKFTMTINEDGSGGKGVDNIICGCLPGSPIPCFNGCGFGPCAFVSPFEFVEVEGKKKWVGNGQICAGGCCPCMTNKGDFGYLTAETDGSTPEKYHSFTAVSMFWPPCVTNTVVFNLTQEGVGPPIKTKGTKLDTIGGSPPAVEMAR